ncbi:uncharacterized protein BDW43DRAFT_315162 [Aspergillus alliaceus]|uniref:uncharacterized protein n=1 Tax=Petromyces alliaceus TaxID=209559 RepID=UPI0012A6930E|nr:uncharacterized protein BDW43DRAFT_315162 [Aspergillus alliaceus]KAB8229178.1 hypothetical protein BDW43DRAFT_315162 [Aspergillus alliaceus]
MKQLLEEAGFRWIKGEAELRQTKVTDNEGGGIEGWIRPFEKPFLQILPTVEARDAAVKHTIDVLEADGRHQHDRSFTVNYIRLRFVAQKPSLGTGVYLEAIPLLIRLDWSTNSKLLTAVSW